MRSLLVHDICGADELIRVVGRPQNQIIRYLFHRRTFRAYTRNLVRERSI